jgi:hypothetical protein
MVLPTQYGDPLVAVGAAGVGLITTLVVPAALVQPDTVTVTLYVPDIAVVADGRVGFCVELLKDAGPLQLYVAPETAGVVKLSVVPEQSGELLLTVGVAGIAFTVIVMLLDVAGLPVTPERLEVMMQVTVCPEVSVLVV